MNSTKHLIRCCATFLLATVSVVSALASDARTPTSFRIQRGIFVNGNLRSLAAIDNDALVVKNGPVLNESESAITIAFEATAPAQGDGNLEISLTSKVSGKHLKVSIELYDFQANQWVEVRSHPAKEEFTTISFKVKDLSRFIQSGTNSIRTRLRVDPQNAQVSNQWSLSIDQLLFMFD